MEDRFVYLHEDVTQYDQKGVAQVEQEPDLYRLDVRGGGQTGGHRDEDGGEDHHAGDVDGVDQVVLRVPGDVVGQLVYQVHQNRRNVGHY